MRDVDRLDLAGAEEPQERLAVPPLRSQDTLRFTDADRDAVAAEQAAQLYG
jgi:hypothetical protein